MIKAIVWIVIIIGGIVGIAALGANPSAQPEPPHNTTVIPKVETRTEVKEEAISFATITTKSDSLYIGENKTDKEGVDGKKSSTYEVTYTDNVETSRKFTKSEVTVNPVDKVVIEGTKAKPVPKPVPKPSCDPNYSRACVPIASDVDCANGSGDGPAYVKGPVKVIGIDIYGLDKDGDGVGCE